MLNIDEIRAKAEALRAGEYDGITVYDHAHDLDALCDEVDRLRKETAVLHRALEMACERAGDLDWCLISGAGITCIKSCKKCLEKYFIQRAREETEK